MTTPLVFFFEQYSTSSVWSARAWIPPRCLVNKFLFSRKNYVQNKREISPKQRRHHRITTLHNLTMCGTVKFVSAPEYHRVGTASILGHVAEFIDPWLGDKVNSGMGLSSGMPGYTVCGPVRQPYAGAELTLSPVRDIWIRLLHSTSRIICTEQDLWVVKEKSQ